MSFGTNHKLLHDESLPVSEENIAASIQEVNTFDADMCGNDLLRAMKTIFSMKRELPLSLFLLTDGHEASKELVIQLMYANVATTRCHGFGIGAGVDEAFVKKLSIAGKGSYHLMETVGNTLKERVFLALERAKEPALSNMSVKWPSELLLQGPKNEQTVFNHQPFCQFGIIQDDFTSGGKVEMKGIETVKMEDVTFEMELS